MNRRLFLGSLLALASVPAAALLAPRKNDQLVVGHVGRYEIFRFIETKPEFTNSIGQKELLPKNKGDTVVYRRWIPYGQSLSTGRVSVTNLDYVIITPTNGLELR